MDEDENEDGEDVAGQEAEQPRNRSRQQEEGEVMAEREAEGRESVEAAALLSRLGS